MDDQLWDARTVQAARSAINQLDTLKADLRREYTLRIVSRPNEESGVWRIPERDPTGRNYYLIVEPIAPDERVLSLPISSEEDGKATVSRWGVRVSKEVFDQVRHDKNDNGSSTTAASARSAAGAGNTATSCRSRGE